MPDLKNRLPHRWGGSINVRGTAYAIDKNGVCRGASDDHALIMLQNPAWSLWFDEAAPAAQPAPVSPALEPKAVPQPETEPEQTGFLRKKKKKKKKIVVQMAPNADE